MRCRYRSRASSLCGRPRLCASSCDGRGASPRTRSAGRAIVGSRPAGLARVLSLSQRSCGGVRSPARRFRRQSLLAKALENNLMLAIREIELRMPDSGAREHAQQLQDQVGSNYAAYFAALDAFRPAGPVLRRSWRAAADEAGTGRATEAGGRAREGRVSEPDEGVLLHCAARAAAAVQGHQGTVDAILAAHPQDLSLKYRMLAFQPTYSGEAARDLIGQETGFGEVHLLIGQRAVMGGNLAGAFRELTRARELLPDSVVDFVRAGECHVLLRALCRRVSAVRSHPFEPRGCRTRTASQAWPRQVVELSEAPRRGHRAAHRGAAKRSEQQSW